MNERKHQKRHCNAWDAALSDAQRDEVFRKATQGGFRWDQIAAWAAEQYGITAPSRDALYRFLGYWRPQFVARRVQERVMARDSIRAQREQVGDMAPELVDALEDEAQARIAGGDLQAGERLFGIAAKIREDVRKQAELAVKRQAEERAGKDLELKLRRLELLERNAEKARDSLKAAVSKGGLEPETLKTIEEALRML